MFEAGYSGTDGIIHTGIGPFDMTGVNLSYGTVRYSRGAFKANFFTNILDGDANALLAVGPDGQPIPFQFDTQTYDFELGHAKTLGTRQVLTYGGNLRRNNFDLSIAPLGNSRTEVGGYIQDEIFLTNQFRFNVGARVDKFANLDDAVFSPRLALIFKPQPDHAIRLSFNRAFRAPSLINNYLQTNIINQVNLGAINPAFAGPRVQLPDGGDRQRGPGAGEHEPGGAGLHRRHQQPRDGVGGRLLHQEHRRDLLHADGPVPRHEPAARAGSPPWLRCRPPRRSACSRCCRRRVRRSPSRAPPVVSPRSSATRTSAR